jgi:predicted transcriptional regulator
MHPVSASEGPRSVKIGADERTGWSSERPRRDGPPRPADISVRCKVLRPSEALRYSPGSMLMIVSGSEADREHLADRVVEQKGALLTAGKVRELLAGRVPDEEMDARVTQLLEAAAAKRLDANDTTVVVTRGLDPAERERFARLAAKSRRPRHLILVEAARDDVAEEDRAQLNELRRRVDTGELGAEGFDTALRLGGASISELKRIVFRPAPRDD